MSEQLSNIEAFVAAIELGSFTRAARRLNLTASAVSRRIGRLEEELGIRLFHRTTRTLRPSEDGQSFYAHCQRILGELRDAKDSVARTRAKPSGRLRVDAPVALGHMVLVPSLPRFLKRYPDIQLSLTLSDHLVDPISAGIDVLIRLGPLEDSGLMVRKLGVTRSLICGAPSYFRRRGMPKMPEDLARHDCLGFLRYDGRIPWVMRTPEGPYIHEPHGTIEVGHGEALRDLVVAGLGLAWFLDFMVTRELETKTLVSVLDDYATIERPISAVYAQRRYLLPRTRVFLDFVGSLFAERGR